MTPRLTKTALATLALSVLVFLVNVPAFYTLYLGPQNAARSEYNLARSAEQQIKEEMASDRLTAEVLQRDNETDNFTTQITNAAQQEVTEARQKINASYLKKAEHETQQLLGEYEKLVAERTPGVQGILGTLLLLPLFLLVISLFSGHVQLKHVQENDDKPGLLGATASVLLSTLLFPVLLTVSLGLFLAWKEVIR